MPASFSKEGKRKRKAQISFKHAGKRGKSLRRKRLRAHLLCRKGKKNGGTYQFAGQLGEKGLASVSGKSTKPRRERARSGSQAVRRRKPRLRREGKKTGKKKGSPSENALRNRRSLYKERGNQKTLGRRDRREESGQKHAC